MDSEELARRIREELGAHDDPNEPVQLLVRRVCERLDRAEAALRDIDGGNGSDSFPLPSIMDLSPDDFRHAMWTWCQHRARAYFAGEERDDA